MAHRDEIPADIVYDYRLTYTVDEDTGAETWSGDAYVRPAGDRPGGVIAEVDGVGSKAAAMKALDAAVQNKLVQAFLS